MIELQTDEKEPEWTHEVLGEEARVQLAHKSSTYNAGEPYWVAVMVNQALSLTLARTLNETKAPVDEAEAVQLTEEYT